MSEETQQAEPQNGAAPEDGQPTLPGTMPDQPERMALIEAVVYVAEEPLDPKQIAEGLGAMEHLLDTTLE